MSGEPALSAAALAGLPPDQLRKVLAKLEAERAKRASRNRLADYRPYPKQRDFHRAGAVYRERLLMAGNQLGKTLCGAAEMSMHMTGLYPPWWDGLRFNRPIRAWAGSQTAEVTRGGIQRNLIGEPTDESAWGTGLLPADNLIDWSRRQGVPDALDSITARHVSGATSTLGFKSYDQGRTKWQGETLDLIWLDEEPPIEVYTEALTRTNATGGAIFMTFTPLFGMSDTVSRFLADDDESQPSDAGPLQ